MIAFYQNLQKGYNKSEALRQAKLNYLNQQADPNAQHPFFWAGMVLSGQDGQLAIQASNNGFYWYVLLVVIITIALTYFLSQRRFAPLEL